MKNSIKQFSLLIENSDKIEVLTEADETTGSKAMYLEGIFAQADLKNGNGRIYPKAVMESALNKYTQQYIQKNRALGELNHPDYPFPDPSQGAIRIIEMHMNGSNVMGKALVLNTPKGQIVRGLLEGGYALGVSTRGLGTIKEDKKTGLKEVQSDYMMTAVDCVDNPSAPDAFPSAVTECRKWMMNESTGSWVPVLDEEKDLKENQELFFKKLQQYLDLIKKK